MRARLAAGMVLWTIGFFSYCFVADNHLQRYSQEAAFTMTILAIIGWVHVVNIALAALMNWFRQQNEAVLNKQEFTEEAPKEEL